ncbi:MAG: HNH endonuclease signature motif containing protein [Nocardioidaceae bacterium]
MTAVPGGRSGPLHLGHGSRLHTTAMRRALALRHDTCAAEGCERPFAWCDIHHPHAWSRGGRTSIEHGVPLCGFHHRRAHDGCFDPVRLPTREIRFRRRRP